MNQSKNKMETTHIDHLAKLFIEMDEDLHSQFECRVCTGIEEDRVVYHIEVKRRLAGRQIR